MKPRAQMRPYKRFHQCWPRSQKRNTYSLPKSIRKSNSQPANRQQTWTSKVCSSLRSSRTTLQSPKLISISTFISNRSRRYWSRTNRRMGLNDRLAMLLKTDQVTHWTTRQVKTYTKALAIHRTKRASRLMVIGIGRRAEWTTFWKGNCLTAS